MAFETMRCRYDRRMLGYSMLLMSLGKIGTRRLGPGLAGGNAKSHGKGEQVDQSARVA
jgi:hypothetical protein